MTIEMIETSRITVAGANRGTVAKDREGALASVTKMIGMRAKATGAANTAAVLPRAEAAITRAAGKTEVGKVTAITPAIGTAATELMGKIITRVPVTSDKTGVVTMAKAPAGMGKARALTTGRAPAGMDRV